MQTQINTSAYPLIEEVGLTNGFWHIASVENAILTVLELPVEARRLTLNAYVFAFKAAYNSTINFRDLLEKEGKL